MEVSSRGGVIYGLFDPRTDELRYIGKTQGKLKVRLNSHLHKARKDPSHHRDRWLKQILDAGHVPQIEILEIWPDLAQLNEAECWSIAYWRSIGCRLTNLTDGGEGAAGYRHTPEARKLMSENMKRKRKGIPRLDLRALSEEQEREMAELYDTGWGCSDLGQRFGLSDAGAQKVVLRQGRILRNAGSGRWTSQRRKNPRAGLTLTVEQVQEAMERYRSGQSAADIATVFGMKSDWSIRREFKAAGVKMRVPVDSVHLAGKGNRCRVRDERGEVFPSIYEACRVRGINRTDAHRILNGKMASVKGVSLERESS